MNKINTDEYEILEGKRGLGHKYADEMERIFKLKLYQYGREEDETIHDYLNRVVINA